MRLSLLHNGHSILQKMQIFVIKSMMGFVPGPIAVLSYRRNFFGKYYTPWLQHSVRKAKHWTVGEIELFGAFVSKKNECQYCTTDHRAVAHVAMDGQVTDAVLADYQTAPVDEKTKAVLQFLEKLTLTPDQLTEVDIKSLQAQELSKEAIAEVINICAVFCTINRLADAFDFELAPNSEKVGRFLYKNGYGSSSLPG